MKTINRQLTENEKYLLQLADYWYNKYLAKGGGSHERINDKGSNNGMGKKSFIGRGIGNSNKGNRIGAKLRKLEA